MAKKNNLLFLQHKYPWESDWKDIANSECIDDNFLKILLEEPDHLIEIEYRIISKEIVQLKNKDKKVIKPIPVFFGKNLIEKIKEIRESRKENAK